MKKRIFKVGILVLILSMFVGTFSVVAAAQPRYGSAGNAYGTISYPKQNFSVTVRGVAGVTQVEVTATLYEKGFWGDKVVGTLSGSSRSTSYYGEQACSIKQGKSYYMTIAASAYINGRWEPIDAKVTADF